MTFFCRLLQGLISERSEPLCHLYIHPAQEATFAFIRCLAPRHPRLVGDQLIQMINIEVECFESSRLS